MVYHAYCEEDEKVISRLTAVQPFLHGWFTSFNRGGVVMFMNDSVYCVKKYVYLVKMENFYEWSLGVVGKGEAAVYHFTLTYYGDKGIVLHEDLHQDKVAENIVEYLNIELCEILDGDIRCYDAVTKTLYSTKLIEEFRKQFDARNESMRELRIDYL
jgi:hypothetical protein